MMFATEKKTGSDLTRSKAMDEGGNSIKINKLKYQTLDQSLYESSVAGSHKE